MEQRTTLIHGYAKKLKNNHKRYFCLSADKACTTPQLQVFDSECKWRSGQSKRCHSLHNLFLVEDVHRTRPSMALGLYLETESIFMVFSGAEERKRWREQLESVAYCNRRRLSYPQVEHAWQASVKFKAKDPSSSPFPLTGACRVCLTRTEVLVFNSSLIKPNLAIEYCYVRQSSARIDGQFKLELGRGAPTRECELVMQLADEMEAKFAVNCMAQVYQTGLEKRNGLESSSHSKSTARHSTSLIESESFETSSRSSNRHSSHSSWSSFSMPGTARSSLHSTFGSHNSDDPLPVDDPTFSSGETIKNFSSDMGFYGFINGDQIGEYIPMNLPQAPKSMSTPTCSTNPRHTWHHTLSLSRRSSERESPQSHRFSALPETLFLDASLSLAPNSSSPSPVIMRSHVASHTSQSSSSHGLTRLSTPSPLSTDAHSPDTGCSLPQRQPDSAQDRVLHYLTRFVKGTSESANTSSPDDLPKRANSLGSRPDTASPSSENPPTEPPPNTPADQGTAETTAETKKSSSTPHLIIQPLPTPRQSTDSLSKTSCSSGSHRDNSEIFMEMSFDSRPRTASDASRYRHRPGISPAMLPLVPPGSTFRSRAASLTPHWMNKRCQRGSYHPQTTATPPIGYYKTTPPHSTSGDQHSWAGDDEYMNMSSSSASAAPSLEHMQPPSLIYHNAMVHPAVTSPTPASTSPSLPVMTPAISKTNSFLRRSQPPPTTCTPLSAITVSLANDSYEARDTFSCPGLIVETPYYANC